MTDDEAMEMLVVVAKQFGWKIAFMEDSEFVNGLIIGTDEYIDSVLGDADEN